MSQNRIEKTFERLSKEGETGLIIFIMLEDLFHGVNDDFAKFKVTSEDKDQRRMKLNLL